MSVNFLDGYEMPHGADHATNLGTIFFHNHIADALQAKSSHGLAVLWLTANH